MKLVKAILCAGLYPNVAQINHHPSFKRQVIDICIFVPVCYNSFNASHIRELKMQERFCDQCRNRLRVFFFFFIKFELKLS